MERFFDKHFRRQSPPRIFPRYPCEADVDIALQIGSMPFSVEIDFSTIVAVSAIFIG